MNERLPPEWLSETVLQEPVILSGQVLAYNQSSRFRLEKRILYYQHILKSIFATVYWTLSSHYRQTVVVICLLMVIELKHAFTYSRNWTLESVSSLASHAVLGFPIFPARFF